LSNYTWSHCTSEVDFGDELGSVHYENPWNRAADKGNCSFDRRHIFNTSVLAVSPGIGSGLLRRVTSAWQLAPIISAWTGQPINITDGGQDISKTAEGNDRPNQVLADIYPAQKTASQWLNPAAFALQANGTFGSIGRNAAYAPGSINFDLNIGRIFPLTERMGLETRGDFFNVMNHANWGIPAGAITSATFGQVTTYGTPRIIQLSLKLKF
jgi:hypothetical protein